MGYFVLSIQSQLPNKLGCIRNLVLLSKLVSSMNEKELRIFLMAQIEEINRYKWIESEKRCQDIGFQQAAFEWIGKHSARFKDNWLCVSNSNRSRSLG